MKKTHTKRNNILPVTPGLVEQKIHIIRGQKAMLDKDLAELYEIETKQLNQQVKRNAERFPKDFMFQLTKAEASGCQIGTLVENHGPRSQIATLNEDIRSQNVTASQRRNKRYLPYAFTELGVAMLSSVLNSDRAVQVNIYIMRAFVKLREIMATNKEVAEKITKLEEGHKENRGDIDLIAVTLKMLMEENGE